MYEKLIVFIHRASSRSFLPFYFFTFLPLDCFFIFYL